MVQCSTAQITRRDKDECTLRNCGHIYIGPCFQQDYLINQFVIEFEDIMYRVTINCDVTKHQDFHSSNALPAYVS